MTIPLDLCSLIAKYCARDAHFSNLESIWKEFKQYFLITNDGAVLQLHHKISSIFDTSEKEGQDSSSAVNKCLFQIWLKWRLNFIHEPKRHICGLDIRNNTSNFGMNGAYFLASILPYHYKSHEIKFIILKNNSIDNHSLKIIINGLIAKPKTMKEDSYLIKMPNNNNKYLIRNIEKIDLHNMLNLLFSRSENGS